MALEREETVTEVTKEGSWEIREVLWHRLALLVSAKVLMN